MWRCSFGRVSASWVGYRRQAGQAQDMETGGRAFVTVDVHYLGSGGARAAAVVAADARFSEIVAERTEDVAEVLPYRPGEFYLRELPPIRTVLRGLSGLGLLVVDGYADLDPAGLPGLGAHAHAEFGIPVIGVAKTAFCTATHAVPVLRGTSARPLFVTAAGMPRDEAAELVRHMAGQHRLPDAIRRADTLAHEPALRRTHSAAARLTKRGSRQLRAARAADWADERANIVGRGAFQSGQPGRKGSR